MIQAIVFDLYGVHGQGADGIDAELIEVARRMRVHLTLSVGVHGQVRPQVKAGVVRHLASPLGCLTFAAEQPDARLNRRADSVLNLAHQLVDVEDVRPLRQDLTHPA